MGFKYVLIPCSPNEEIKELEYHEDIVDLTKDSYREFIEKYFSSLGGSVDRSVLLQQLKERTGCDLQGKDGPDIDRLLTATSVEIFPVLLPTKASGFIGISVYCDDKGIAKCLEENPRMSAMIQAAGYTGQTFRGDCFIGRILDDNEDEWRRLDFSMKDVSADADWVQMVKSQRANRNVGDMGSLAKSMGMKNNVAQINPGTMADAESKGETDQYCWRQADDEVEVTFKKDDLEKGDKKLVKVTFGRQKLKVEAKGEVLFDAELFAPTQPDEAIWTLADGVLQVTLTKAESESWSRLLKSD